jgi:ADP-heptose:LPS heptosyltransferase
LRYLLAQAGVDPARPHVVVHPGATAASRSWPARRFGEAAAQISTGLHCQVLVTGGPGDREAVDEAMQAAGTCAGRSVMALPASLSLGELAALIESARAVLCNNSGPAHLAAALGTPVVVVYAMTNPQHTPWQVRSRVLQRLVPCRHCLKSVCPLQHHACLTDVPVSEAVDAVHALALAEVMPRDGTPTAPAAVVPVAA